MFCEVDARFTKVVWGLMKGLILAAGRGSRLNELTEIQPKCFLQIHGRPLIEWQLSSLRESGVSPIGIVTGYKSDYLNGFGDTRIHNDKWSRTNMVESLLCADTWLSSDTCIVSYSDILYQNSAVIDLQSCDDDVAIAYDPNWLKLWSKRFVDPLSDAESFSLNEHGYLTSIGSKCTSIDGIQGQFMGLIKITPVGWRSLKKVITSQAESVRSSLQVTGLLSELVKSELGKVACIPYFDTWMEIDSATDFEIAIKLDFS